MTRRALRFSPRAASDLKNRARILKQERGKAFAEAYAEAFIGWLSAIAESGAKLGSTVGDDASLRRFGYRRQATVLADFADTEMRIVRVYFRGQDWTADF